MPLRFSNPCLRPGALLLVALSLSIGWGIRGNYGHETGAMFPGALAAMAVCLVSGRADWQARVGYFAFFGMLGWAFGGSISYMMVIGYTQSGHSSTQAFGFGGLFLIGFLWAALGGAGTALPAVLDRRRLNEIFVPLSLLLGLWVLMYFFLDPLMQQVQHLLELDGIASPMVRQESALYWFDSDWLEVSIILCGILLFDLIDRRFAGGQYLAVFAFVGALVGWAVMFAIDRTDSAGWLATHLVQYQGIYADRFTADQLAVTNWPRIVLFLGSREGLLCRGEMLGTSLGILIAVAAYFIWFGKFRRGAALFLYMAVGWFVGFLALSVIGSLFFGEHGGLRMTPPRSENWSGIVGTFAGAMIYLLRNQLKSIALAAVVCGTIGGIGFSGTAWLESMLVSFGNPRISTDADVQQAWTDWQNTVWEPTDWLGGERMPPPEFARQLSVDPAWQHYQSQNWHSVLEQSYGFINGIGLAVALGLLATRVPRVQENVPKWRWTEVMAISFALPVLTFVNMIKNVRQWTAEHGAHRSLPEVMKAPWIDFEMTAWGWFVFFFAIASVAFVFLLARQYRRPMSIVPSSWLGRGQLLYFLLAWAFVLGNNARAFSAFGEGRLLTEGIILINAVIATVLLLCVTREPSDDAVEPTGARFGRWLIGATVIALILAVAVPALEWHSVRRVYRDAQVGHHGMDFRFGPNANWKRKPLLKGELHR